MKDGDYDFFFGFVGDTIEPNVDLCPGAGKVFKPFSRIKIVTSYTKSYLGSILSTKVSDY